jgi:hypothetical protein
MGKGEPELPASGATTAYHPRAMLAMLTYCYAIGVYGSQDVEELMYSDADFRALCGMNYPDWKQLKRFRRRNLDRLLRTLRATFHGAWSLTCRAGDSAETEAAPEWIEAEAQSRIDRAKFIDLMAVE